MALEYFIQYNTDIGVSFPYINHITYLTNQSFLYLFGFIQARKKTFYSGGRYLLPRKEKGAERRENCFLGRFVLLQDISEFSECFRLERLSRVRRRLSIIIKKVPPLIGGTFVTATGFKPVTG